MVTEQQIKQRLGSEVRLDERLSKARLKQVLNKLCDGHFDNEVFDELYGVCSKQGDSVLVQEFAEKTSMACSILNDRIRSDVNKLAALQRELADLPAGSSAKRTSLQRQIDNTRSELTNERDELALLEKTFGPNRGSIPAGGGEYRQLQEESQGTPSVMGMTEGTTLKVLFFLALITLLFQIGMGFGQPNFPALVSVSAILSIFLVNYFDRQFVRVCLLLNGVSIVLDIVWLCVHFGTWSSPPAVSPLFAGFKGGYIFTLVMTIILLVAKIAMEVLLFMNREVRNTDTKTITFCLNKQLELGNCPLSPVTRAVYPGESAGPARV